MPGFSRVLVKEKRRKHRGLSAVLAAGAVLGLAAAGLFSLAVADDEDPAASEQSGYVGSEMCIACHEERHESYEKTAHAWVLAEEPSRPPAKSGCEACHGPGEAHAEEGGGEGVGDLQTFSKSRPAAQRSAVCLGCHAGVEGMHAYRSSVHAVSGIACTDCHAGHEVAAESLLRSAMPELCYGCHLEKRAEFALPEHHKVNEGVVKCIDCHNPHGSRKRIALLAPDNRRCFRCHGEIQGPFVFEHGAVLTEGCIRCHAPHGSTNRHLLKYQQVAQLCYECHIVTPADHLQPSFRDCTRCHVSVHGSNVDPHLLEQ